MQGKRHHKKSGFSGVLLATLLLTLVLPPQAAISQELEEHGSLVELDFMNQGRYNHTISHLSDGWVLVTGGTADGKNSLASAEIFYPAYSQEWSSVGNMSEPRMRHTATTLANGQLLIVGGYQGNGFGYPSLHHNYNGTGNLSLASCELFRAGTGEFQEAASLETGRFWHRAVLLQDGKVLVIGGLNVSQGALTSCEIYDPVTMKWSTADNMSIPRARFTATLLPNGSILVTGGHDGVKKQAFASCELYVPSQDRWYQFPAMNEARGYHSANLLQRGGLVMVSGGFSEPGVQDRTSAEIFDPSTMEWSTAGNMSLPRHNHETATLPTGDVLVLSGSNCLTGGAHSGIEYYNPTTGSWNDTNLVMLGLKWSNSLVLEDGSVFLCGGLACIIPTKRSFLYIPPDGDPGGGEDEGSFLPAPGLLSQLAIHSILVLEKKRRLIKQKYS
jgi:hypothetical protein